MGEYRETELHKSECLRINYDKNKFTFFCKSNGKNITSDSEINYIVTSYNINYISNKEKQESKAKKEEE